MEAKFLAFHQTLKEIEQQQQQQQKKREKSLNMEKMTDEGEVGSCWDKIHSCPDNESFTWFLHEAEKEEGEGEEMGKRGESVGGREIERGNKEKERGREVKLSGWKCKRGRGEEDERKRK